jgi:uncharacterized membrane protein
MDIRRYGMVGIVENMDEIAIFAWHHLTRHIGPLRYFANVSVAGVNMSLISETIWFAWCPS